MSFLNQTIARAKGMAITYPQVFLPGIAGAAVRSITGSSSKGQSPKGKKLSPKAGHALEVGQPGKRYAPALPDNGRTSGILVAQTAAAPQALSTPVNQTIQPADED